jgi:hypothetical protein
MTPHAARSTMEKLMKLTSALAFAALSLCSTASFAFDKPTRWTANTSPVFPLVRVFGCPNHFATNFPTFDMGRIAYQTRNAANTWFTEGGADLRLRYAGDLAASDPRCATGSGSPNPGEILLTAERNHGGGACNLATTFWWWNGSGEITSATVILHRGTVCGGSYGDYNWDPGVDYPGAAEFDFQSTILHELGHAIGFNHSGDPTSIMWPSAAPGQSAIRNLANDDLLGLQQSGASYGMIQTVSRHRYTSAASPPTAWFDEGETIPGTLLGAPAVAHSALFDPSRFYLVAYTRASDRAVMFGRTNGFQNSAAGFTQVAAGVTSNRPPAVTAGTASANELLAYADLSSDGLLTRRNTGAVWTAPLAIGQTSRVAPALAYLPGRDVYVLAWAAFPSGLLHTMVSSDGGQSWHADQAWSFRTFHSFGLTCRATDECVLAFANGESHLGRLAYLTLGYDAAQSSLFMGPFRSSDVGADTYGAGVTTGASGRTQLGWRDRGTATVLTSGGWSSSPGTLDTTIFLPGVTSAAPRLAYNASWNEFTMWSSHATRYDPQ